MKNFALAVQKFLDDDQGLTAIEYGLIAAVLVVAVIVTVSLVARQLDATYVNVKNCVLSPSTCK
ncbi:MAG: Flp family type IVb pilin [Rhodoferax sp.]